MKLLLTLPQADNMLDMAWPYPLTRDYSEEVIAWICDPLKMVTARQLDSLPNLELLVTPSTGTNHIPRDLLAQKRIEMRCLLDDREALGEIKASSEFTFLLILAALRNLKFALGETAMRRWHTNEQMLWGNELYNKRVGLVGFGRIGGNLHRYCVAFCAYTVICDPPKYPDGPSLEEVFSTCDIICICCTYNEKTHGMIDRSVLYKMKQGAILVNTSRGEVINEEDLVEFLRARPDIRVALDVLTHETTNGQLGSPLLGMANVTVTPHIAGSAVESLGKAARIAHALVWRWFEECQ